jgi:hypothetical protein
MAISIPDEFDHKIETQPLAKGSKATRRRHIKTPQNDVLIQRMFVSNIFT